MKNPNDLLYLSAREAARELSISPATLYAYVSRGLIRSEPVEDTRARRYRAEDVRSLKNRRAPMDVGRGGDGGLPAILDTAVSTITEEGPIYRGVCALDLAEEATLEQVSTLLWDANRADPFAADNLPVVSETMRVVAAAAAEQASVARAIAVLALAGDSDPTAFNRSAEGRARIGARAMRLLTATLLNGGASAAPLHRQVAQAWAPQEPKAAGLLRRALVLLADHEFNASTWTLRCAASTGLNLYDAVIAGLVALKGPRHGGAGPLAAHMVADLAEGDMAAKIRRRVALGERIPGFGHTVYKNGDPRAQNLLAAVADAYPDDRLSVQAPAMISEAIGLHPNIDFALAVTMRTLGIPIGHEIELFAIARTAGWIAHGIEQLRDEKLIRPRGRYVGPAPARG